MILSASRSSATLSLSISDPLSLNFILSDISVSYLGVNCLGLSGVINSFTCSLPLNSDSTIALPAGNAIPVIHVLPIGYALSTNISPTIIPITITSITPVQTSPGGGI